MNKGKLIHSLFHSLSNYGFGFKAIVEYKLYEQILQLNKQLEEELE